jgi:NAD(P)-dependent dehydrogenase (short-subunit alcohol dehydrogenase family)
MTDSNSNDLRTAFVTGGSRGIGKAATAALLERGWQVYFCSRSDDKVAAAESEMKERFGADAPVHGDSVDVRDQAAVDAYVARIESESGGIDCLVNNAGLGIFGKVDELTGDQWRQVLGTNLDGAFYVLRAVAVEMKRRGRGWIFNIASLASRNPFPGGAAYNASKFGLLGLSDAAMLDLRPHGVKVMAILPGSVDTDFQPPGGEAKDTSWMLGPEDIARTIVDFLDYPERALPSRVELRPTRPGGR